MAKSEEAKAQLELAESMRRLAGAIERFQDPVWIQKVFSDAMRSAELISAQLPPPLSPRLGLGRIEGVTVSLTEEDRKKLAKRVYEALKPQLKDFNKFVRASLKEMPVHRLKSVAAALERGEKPELKRRRGCVYVAMDGGEEYYLGL